MGRNRPAIILNHYEDRQLMYRRLTEENSKIIGCHATIASAKGHHALCAVALKGKVSQ
jgi:hypothetical protein